MATSDEPNFLPFEFGGHHHKELVSFYVRPNDADKSLFESAYNDFVEYVSSPFWPRSPSHITRGLFLIPLFTGP